MQDFFTDAAALAAEYGAKEIALDLASLDHAVTRLHRVHDDHVRGMASAAELRRAFVDIAAIVHRLAPNGVPEIHLLNLRPSSGTAGKKHLVPLAQVDGVWRPFWLDNRLLFGTLENLESTMRAYYPDGYYFGKEHEAFYTGDALDWLKRNMPPHKFDETRPGGLCEQGHDFARGPYCDRCGELRATPAPTPPAGRIEMVDAPVHNALRIWPDVRRPRTGEWFVQIYDEPTQIWLPRGAVANSYTDALAMIEEYASDTGKLVHVVKPSLGDLELWAYHGFIVGGRPLDDAEELPAMTATQAAAAVQEIAREITGAQPVEPVPGTLHVSPQPDGFYAVQRWSQGQGWDFIAEDLTWDEAEDHLRGSGERPDIAPGACEIRDGAEPGQYDVYQWTGKTWKQIGGGVSMQTAKGIVRARKNDPERPASGPSKRDAAIAKLRDIRKDVETIRDDLEGWRRTGDQDPRDCLDEIHIQIMEILKKLDE